MKLLFAILPVLSFGYLFPPKLNFIHKTNIKYNTIESLKPPNRTFPINGFYGLIGPNIDYKKINSLYDLFIGDGIIQGIFLENNTATFIKSFVKTEKLILEEHFGKMPNNLIMNTLTALFHHVKFIPNMLGVANTAFMNLKNKTYVLFERDMPYEINIDFKQKKIDTIKRKNIAFLNTFSGHSKYINGYVETIEYLFFKNCVVWYQMNENFEKEKEIYIPMKYLPMSHDFYSNDDYVIIIDSPLSIDFNNLFKSQIPIFLNKTMPTYIYLIEKKSGIITRYISNESFYLFHFANVNITKEYINITSPFYDTMDYNTISHDGKYRKLVIDRNTGISSFLPKNIELENLSLDFPVLIDNDTYILRNIKNNKINGFYILKDLEIINEIIFEDRFICGEPSIKIIDNEKYLLFFAFSEYNKKQYFMIINLNTNETIEYNINHKLSIGFHSIFIDK
jgi:hypothetical protein